MLQRLGVEKVDISGGEPLSYPPLPDIVEGVAKRRIHQTITTSGFGPSKNSLYVAENAQKFARVILSLDAPSSEGHDYLRQTPGAFESALRLIALIKKETVTLPRINTVITRSFIERCWLEPMSNLVAEQASEWCIIQTHPANQKEKYQDFATGDEQFAAIADSALHMKLPIPVLVRRRSLYSKYWILHPAGILTQHTEASSDSRPLDVSNGLTPEVEKIISESYTALPTTEKL